MKEVCSMDARVAHSSQSGLCLGKSNGIDGYHPLTWPLILKNLRPFFVAVCSSQGKGKEEEELRKGKEEDKV